MSKPWYLSVLRNRAQLQSELPSQNPTLCLAWIQAPEREDLSSYGHLGAEGRGVGRHGMAVAEVLWCSGLS